jgi:beta-lactamase superfamily II metal-dependent hydrolase
MATRKHKAHKDDDSAAPGRRSIRIRMYRVGFGDCFLVSLPSGGEGPDHHILVDCGVHGRGNIDTIDRVIENIAAVTGKQLAIVIATHSHQDHISGFDPKKFDGFEAREVWLPWTENPKNVVANRLRKKQMAIAGQLQEHIGLAIAKSGESPELAAARDAMENFLGPADVKLASNRVAMQFLQSGFGSGIEPKYLEAGMELKNPAKIPGLTVRVLGPPPPRDSSFLAKMDPPEGHRYLRMNDGGGEWTNVVTPFASSWKVTRKSELPKMFGLSKEVEGVVQEEVVSTSLSPLAFALDSVKNNTSVVVLLSFRGEHLLFPGDAQYGNWMWWLQQPEAAEILSEISFLKVAHHGSVNATPTDLLEHLTDGGFAAMVSTQNVPWDVIPREPLMTRLGEKSGKRVVRSDSLRIPHAPSGPKVALPAGFSQGDLWYDYFIQV